MRFERVNAGRGHTYLIDGRKVPGVTTLINDGQPKQLTKWAAQMAANSVLDDWDEVSTWPVSRRLDWMTGAPFRELAAAAKRGTDIHALAWALITGEAVEVPEEYAGPVGAVVEFMDTWHVEPVLRETPVFHRDHWWAGTIDLTADIGGTRWLLDWKTGRTLFDSVALQLAAYNHAQFVTTPDSIAPWEPCERVGVVHIQPDVATLHEVDAGDDTYTAFRHVATVAKWTGRARDAWRDGIPWPVGAALGPPAKETQP